MVILMEMELTNLTMETNTQDIGNVTREMEMELFILTMGINT